MGDEVLVVPSLSLTLGLSYVEEKRRPIHSILLPRHFWTYHPLPQLLQFDRWLPLLWTTSAEDLILERDSIPFSTLTLYSGEGSTFHLLKVPSGSDRINMYRVHELFYRLQGCAEEAEGGEFLGAQYACKG